MKKNLTLSIKQIYFDEILAGNKKKETRSIWPNNLSRYCELDENGEVLLDKNDRIVPRNYDTITFLTGAYSGTRPRMVVEVQEAEIFILTNEFDEPIEYEWEDGSIRLAAQIDYLLGNILQKPEDFI